MKQKKPNLKKVTITILKVGVSVLLFYFVLTKISFGQILNLIKQSNAGWVLLSGVFLLLSQIISSFRLNILFRSLGYSLSEKSNLILYFIGMFYNFFIPGGIGGDAYKVYKLNREFGWSVKKLTGALFVGRFSGLVIIMGLVLLMSFPFVNNLNLMNSPLLLGVIIICLLLLGGLICYQLIKKFFPQFKNNLFKILFYSFGVQILQLISIYCLVNNFGASQDLWSYCIVFLVSVVLSIISFAGIGVREFVFYKAADLLHYSKNTSVAIGLLFTFITALISLTGIIFQLKKVRMKS